MNNRCNPEDHWEKSSFGGGLSYLLWHFVITQISGSGELWKHCASALLCAKAIMAETAMCSPKIHFLGTLGDSFAVRCGHETEL